MKARHRKKPKQTRKNALERIRYLFQQAEENPEFSDRYVEQARKLAMKTKTPVPSELKKRFCSHCYTFFRPGVNCRVRATGKTVSYYCKSCRRYTRISY